MSASASTRELEVRTAEIRAAEIEASNLARSLLQHAEDSIELADTTLIGVAAHRLETEGFRPEAITRLQSFLYLRKATLPRLRGSSSMRQTGPGRHLGDGETSRATTIPIVIISGIISPRTTEPRSFGPPVRSRSRGHWIITVSRRVNGPDGQFAGVVLATLDVDYFVRGFSHFHVGTEGSLALLTPTGTLLARYPMDEQVIAAISRLARHAERCQRQLRRRPFPKRPRRVERISAYHRSEKSPCSCSSQEAGRRVLATWWTNAQWRMAMVAGLTLLIATFGAIMLKELAARQRLLRSFPRRKRTSACSPSHPATWSREIAFDGTLTYVSPSSLRILGWGPEELLGGHALAA